jgi:hypothetical protein
MTANVYPGFATNQISSEHAIRQLLRLTVGLAIFMLPVGGTVTPNSWTQPFIMMCDVVPFIAVLLGLAQAIKKNLPRSAFFRIGLLFVGAEIISSAVHFSFLGVVSILRIFGMLVIAETLASLDADDRAKCEKALVCVGVFELLLTCFQRITGKPLSPKIIEFGTSAFLGEARIPIGSFQFHYTVAALGLLVGAVSVLGILRSTLASRWALPGIGSGAYLAIQSAGRSAALGVVCLVIALGFGSLRRPAIRRKVLQGFLVLVLSSAIGVGASAGVWNNRTQTAALKRNGGRGPLVEQAIGLWRSSPAFGVGAGRYGKELSERKSLLALSPSSVVSVHNVPLFIAAETGALGLFGLAGFAVLLLKRVKKLGLIVFIPATAIAPLLLFDVLHWAIPTGVLQLGVFIGLIGYRPPDSPSGHAAVT